MKERTHIAEKDLRDEALIREAKVDPEKFRPLYTKYYKQIFLFVFHRVGEKEVSADITSQVFLKALTGLANYQFKGFPFSSWLYRIAVNECNDYFRKHKRQRLVVLEEGHVHHLYEEMFGDSLMDDLKVKLPLILEKLKPDELQVIELRFLEARSFREVAEILQISETYAKVRTYRILEKMKKMFIR